MTSLLPPYEDAEVAALMAWLDCWRELIDRRYPPEDPPPKPAPRRRLPPTPSWSLQSNPNPNRGGRQLSHGGVGWGRIGCPLGPPNRPLPPPSLTTQPADSALRGGLKPHVSRSQ